MQRARARARASVTKNHADDTPRVWQLVHKCIVAFQCCVQIWINRYGVWFDRSTFGFRISAKIAVLLATSRPSDMRRRSSDKRSFVILRHDYRQYQLRSLLHVDILRSIVAQLELVHRGGYVIGE